MNHRPVYVFFHIAELGNWKSILTEQIQALSDSELLVKADKVFLSYVGSHEGFELLRLMTPEQPNISLLHASQNIESYEFATLKFLEHYLKNHDGDILYIHTKGASAIEEPHKTASSNWRKYMNFYVIKCWRLCLIKLAQFDAVSISQWHDKQNQFRFFCGNFWWSKSEYLKTCRSVSKMDHNNRWDAEWWMGTGDSIKVFSWENKYWTTECFQKMNTDESDWWKNIQHKVISAL